MPRSYRRALTIGIALLIIGASLGVIQMVRAAHCPPIGGPFEPCDYHGDEWDTCPLGQDGSYTISIDTPGNGENVGASATVTYSSTASGPLHHVDIIAAGTRYAGLSPNGSQTVALTGSNDVIYAEVYCAFNHIAASTQITVNTTPPPTPSPTPGPPPVDNAAFVSYGGPASVAANQVFSVPITMRNTGTTTWTIGGNYRLGALNAFWGVSRATWSFVNGVPSTGPVPPNSTATFVFNATAPAAPGTYGMNWQMLVEGGSAFGAVSPPAVTVANQFPAGIHDAATCDGATSWGWARDPDTAPAPVSVHIYRDGPAGGGGVFVAAVTANQFRGDIPFPDQNHGFSFLIPPGLRDGTPHTYYAYSINDSGGANPQLAGSPRSVTCYQAPVVTLSGAPNPVPYGNPAAMTWSTTNPGGTVCVGSGGTAGWVGDRTTSGIFATDPIIAPVTFTLTCSNPSGSDVRSVTLNPIPPVPPTVIITSIEQPDYCQNGPQATVHWEYGSSAGLVIVQWQVRVFRTDTSTVTPVPIYDSGVQDGSTQSMSTGPGPWFTYGQTYLVRLDVWDAAGGNGQDTEQFTTPSSAYPRVDFTVTPEPPIAGQTTTFTDTTDYGTTSATAREWNFGDGVIDTQTPGNPVITHTYASTANITATLTVWATSSVVNSCSVSKDLTVSKPIPSYREVRPGTLPLR